MAVHFSGIIDFGGALLRPISHPGGFLFDKDWDEIKPLFESWKATMPGTIYGHQYISFEKRRVHHFADTVFFEAWLKHPDFGMIK